IAKQSLYPVFCCSSEKNMGSGRLMGFINDVCPSPADAPAARLEGGGTLKCDASGPTTIFIYKTVHENRVGNLSYFKVYSGTLHTSDELINANTRNSERFGSLSITNGKNRESVHELKAGDIGVTVKLKETHTGHTLNTKGTDRKI